MKYTLKQFFVFFIMFSVFLIGRATFGFSVINAAYEGNKAVDVVDTIKISNIYDREWVYAAWSKEYPDKIAEYETVKSGEEIWFSFEWSIKDSDGIKSGDYFTLVFPDIFDHSAINPKDNAELQLEDGTLIAVYSITQNHKEEKEITVIFTEAVNTHKDISGTYGISMSIIQFENDLSMPFTFTLNNALTEAGSISGINPPPIPNVYGDAKYGGRAETFQLADGYYYFKWTVWINFDFKTIENFSFQDVIPPNSLHSFITDSTIAELGITLPPEKQYLHDITIREYIGSDELRENERYSQFQEHLNNIGGWYEDYTVSYKFTDGRPMNFPLQGIENTDGMIFSDFAVNRKSMSGDLGRITRPVIIDYYTIATIKLNESAIYDLNTTKQFENTFTGTGLNPMKSFIYDAWISEESNVTGVKGDNLFSFKKTDEEGRGLENALFSLYINKDCTGGAFRFSSSDSNGTVTFSNLKAGIYYLRETEAPDGYEISDNIYIIDLRDNSDYTIYNLADSDSEISDKIITNIPQDTSPTPHPTTVPTTTAPPATVPQTVAPPATTVISPQIIVPLETLPSATVSQSAVPPETTVIYPQTIVPPETVTPTTVPNTATDFEIIPIPSATIDSAKLEEEIIFHEPDEILQPDIIDIEMTENPAVYLSFEDDDIPLGGVIAEDIERLEENEEENGEMSFPDITVQSSDTVNAYVKPEEDGMMPYISSETNIIFNPQTSDHLAISIIILLLILIYITAFCKAQKLGK